MVYSHDRMLHSNANEQSGAADNNVDVPYKYNLEQEK